MATCDQLGSQNIACAFGPAGLGPQIWVSQRPEAGSRRLDFADVFVSALRFPLAGIGNLARLPQCWAFNPDGYDCISSAWHPAICHESGRAVFRNSHGDWFRSAGGGDSLDVARFRLKAARDVAARHTSDQFFA